MCGVGVATALGLFALVGCGFATKHHGPPGEPPSTAEVEQSQRRFAEETGPRPWSFGHNPPGDLSGAVCRKPTPRAVWFCTLRFSDGLVVVDRVAWYQNADAQGVSMVSARGHY